MATVSCACCAAHSVRGHRRVLLSWPCECQLRRQPYGALHCRTLSSSSSSVQFHTAKLVVCACRRHTPEPPPTVTFELLPADRVLSSPEQPVTAAAAAALGQGGQRCRDCSGELAVEASAGAARSFEITPRRALPTSFAAATVASSSRLI